MFLKEVVRNYKKDMVNPFIINKKKEIYLFKKIKSCFTLKKLE
jgi:hypothetical protein